jgi:hypothetical protein
MQLNAIDALRDTLAVVDSYGVELILPLTNLG